MRTLILVAAAAFAAGCGGGDGNGDGGEAQGGCEDVDAPNDRDTKAYAEPEDRLDPARTYRLTVRTNCGDFTVELDPQASPNAAASVYSLAENGFFDGTTFHRVVPGFVIQGGDPTGTGSGGPGYSTVDPPDRATRYTKGVVAMAKTQTDPAGTAGSQFFVVTAEDAQLPPDYAVIGRVVDGMDAVERIERLGDATMQRPSQPVVIEKVDAEIS